MLDDHQWKLAFQRCNIQYISLTLRFFRVGQINQSKPFRLMMYWGWRRSACNFISPHSPYFVLKRKVSQISIEAQMRPKPIHTHCSMTTMYMMTNRKNRASRPLARMNRHWLFSPLISVLRPIPLLIGYSVIIRGKKSVRLWRLRLKR